MCSLWTIFNFTGEQFSKPVYICWISLLGLLTVLSVFLQNVSNSYYHQFELQHWIRLDYFFYCFILSHLLAYPKWEHAKELCIFWWRSCWWNRLWLGCNCVLVAANNSLVVSCVCWFMLWNHRIFQSLRPCSNVSSCIGSLKVKKTFLYSS